MYAVIGPKFYEVAQDDSRLSVMVPRVEFVETGFEYDLDEQRKLRIERMIKKYEKEKAAGGNPRYPNIPSDDEPENLNTSMLYEAMREDFNRQLTIQRVLDNLIDEGDCCLVLGDSLEHLEYMFKYIKCRGRWGAFVNGETPKKIRDKIMADMRGGKYQYLFATYALAKLGLDIPRLNRLVLVTPHRDKTSIQQAVGRIMRPFEGKVQPIVYDIYDSRVPTLVHWARERKKVYKRLGCRVDGGPVVRKW
jgi:superfamily II DNA or RNA helicase